MREHGYYWVKIEGRWNIAHYAPTSGRWLLSYEYSCPHEGRYTEAELMKVASEIGPRIEFPS
jgi:hypothetical protein